MYGWDRLLFLWIYLEALLVMSAAFLCASVLPGYVFSVGANHYTCIIGLIIIGLVCNPCKSMLTGSSSTTGNAELQDAFAS